MRCDQIRPWLNAYGEGTLPAYKAAWVSQHLAWCPECALETARRKRRSAAPAAVCVAQTAQTQPADRIPGRPSGRWLRRTALLSVLTLTAVFLASRYHLIR